MSQMTLFKPKRPRRPKDTPRPLRLAEQRRLLAALIDQLAPRLHQDPDYTGISWPGKGAKIAWATLQFKPLIQEAGQPESYLLTILEAGTSLLLSGPEISRSWPVDTQTSVPDLALEIDRALTLARIWKN